MTYTTQRFDTLWDIADRTLGDGTRWRVHIMTYFVYGLTGPTREGIEGEDLMSAVSTSARVGVHTADVTADQTRQSPPSLRS